MFSSIFQYFLSVLIFKPLIKILLVEGEALLVEDLGRVLPRRQVVHVLTTGLDSQRIASDTNDMSQKWSNLNFYT